MSKIKNYFHDEICAQGDTDYFPEPPDNYEQVLHIAKRAKLSEADCKVLLSILHYEDADWSNLSYDGYDKIMEYSNAFEDMPYGTQKARTGCPYEWLANYFEGELQ